MKVFVAGATGAIGRQLVPILVERGHEVVGMTQTASKRGLLRELGAEPVVADALDPEAVGAAVSEAEPEVIVHQLTAIPSTLNPRKLDAQFRLTNRLRTEGTDHLLSAARAVGARRFVAQSFAAWLYARTGGPVKTEEDPLDTNPPRSVRETAAGIRHVERAVTATSGIEGLVLRYGGFYGPGTSLHLDPPTEQVEMIRARKLPIVGGGTAIWSFVHIADAAAATADAVERGRPGIYNVADDEPVAFSEWVEALAAALGAPPPRRVPRWVGRLFGGETGVVMMTELRGISSEKAKRELGWHPRYPSWRRGLGLAEAGAGIASSAQPGGAANPIAGEAA